MHYALQKLISIKLPTVNKLKTRKYFLTKAFSLSGTVTTGGSNFIGRVTVPIDTNDPDNFLK